MMAKKEFSAFTFLLIFLLSQNPELKAQHTDSVRLNIQLDLSEAIAEGWLNPQEEKVGLRGDTKPLSWGTTFLAADENGDGIYEAEIPFVLTSDSLLVSLKIKVDGTNNPDDGWQKGRNHVVTVKRSKNNSVTIGWNDEPEELKPTFTGNIQKIDHLKGNSLKDRPVYVYLPPNYDKETERNYPVLYLHDGQNVFDVRAVGREWQVDETAERLIKNGTIEPLIIVAIGNTDDRIDEYTPTEQAWRHTLKRAGEENDGDGRLKHYAGTYITPENDSLRIKNNGDSFVVMIPGGDDWQELIARNDSTYFQPRSGITLHFPALQSGSEIHKIKATKPPVGGNGDCYLAYVTEVVKPYVNKTYRTKPEPQFTALGGSSLGGLITMYAGLNYSEYQHLLVLSPSVWWDSQILLKMVEEYDGVKNHSVWLYIGTGEGSDMVRNTLRLKELLKVKGWESNKITYVEKADAAHTEQAWADQAENFLEWLNSRFQTATIAE